MLIFLEIFTAFVSIRMLYTQAVRYRFHNYATSIFLSCFSPLFCVYPVIARLAVGGAYSVQPGDNLVIGGTFVYVVYQLFCLGILLVTAISAQPRGEPLPDWGKNYTSSVFEQIALLSVITAGIYLYVLSTGYSAIDLIAASRFEWFSNAAYSPVLFVISTYLMAIAPVAILIALHNKKYWWVALVIISELAFFGLMSKDRKWLIYILSASFAYFYIKNQFTINLKPRFIIAGLISALILAFWQIFRGVIFTYLITGSGDVVLESQEVAINLMTKGDLPYYYNASMTAINMNINYDYSIPFGLIRRQAFFFLPASYSFGLKIEDISALFSDALGAEDSVRRGNMPPGLFGLFILSFGWIGGIITCSLLPLLLRALDRLIQRSRGLGSIVIVSHMLSATMLLLRGDDSSATYFIITSIAIFYMIRPSALLERKRNPAL